MQTVWLIENLVRQESDNFVTDVAWRVTAEDEGITATTAGVISFSPAIPTVPYQELTETLVLGWVKDNLGSVRVSAIESSLIEEINTKKTPLKVNGLPW